MGRNGDAVRAALVDGADDRYLTPKTREPLRQKRRTDRVNKHIAAAGVVKPREACQVLLGKAELDEMN